ncbi:MAG: helix-turn-helix domain-containing protein, partial [Bacteroidales bacterium]|nr:helix-turn-helix domain-containing protein [Bacteroidales bacterium]
MKDLGSRLTEFRKAKGLSQETLAEDAGISLRTLQRIEKEGTNPHGDTLKRIAEVLDVSMDELLDHSLEVNYNYIRGMHYSALTMIFLPLGNIILPIIFWVRKKERIKDLSFYSKNLLNWQVTWTIL